MQLIEDTVSGLTRVNGAANTDTLLARLCPCGAVRERARWREAVGGVRSGA